MMSWDSWDDEGDVFEGFSALEHTKVDADAESDLEVDFTDTGIMTERHSFGSPWKKCL